METLGEVVGGINSLEHLMPYLAGLAARHAEHEAPNTPLVQSSYSRRGAHGVLASVPADDVWAISRLSRSISRWSDRNTLSHNPAESSPLSSCTTAFSENLVPEAGAAADA